ncbi:MAG: hypothetical protein MZV65_46125 [Chromatiales bacterium]|nr:hypothetical protein [Chromatiales bacterium]
MVQYFLDENYSLEKLLAQIECHLGKPYLQSGHAERGGGRRCVRTRLCHRVPTGPRYLVAGSRRD